MTVLQSTMTKYFVFQNEQPTALALEEDLDFEIGSKTVKCIIYVYFIPVTNTAVYGGQTMQKLETRDKQHLKGSKQEFDKVYTSKSKFELRQLEQKTFTADIRSKSDDTGFIESYGTWMDDREKYYINKYDTWKGKHGFNQNEGGQGLQNHVRNAQEAFKRSLTKFSVVKWPAMLAFWKRDRAELPGIGTHSLVMCTRNEPIIGVLIDCIRTGHTAVPAFYKKKMIELGHADNKSEGLFKQQYIPLINKILLEDRFKLPGTGTPALAMISRKEPINNLGAFINSIRSGNTAVPARYKSWFDEKGMLWDTSNVAKHVLRKMGIRRRIRQCEFELDDTVSLDPENNEDLANRLEELRCFLLEEKLPGRRFNMAAKKYTATRETFVAKYRRDLEVLKSERRACL
jgi:hypothetical protein